MTVVSTLVLILAVGAPASTRRAPAQTPATTTAQGEARTHAPDTEVTQVRLRTRGVELVALTRELTLRLPDTAVVAHDGAALPGTFFVFVDVAPADRPDMLALTLVTSDGRAFDRQLARGSEAEIDDDARVVASHIANLVAAIESGSETPDRSEVALPAPAVPAACPVCPPVVAAPVVIDRPTTTPSQPPPPPPTFELGVAVSPGVVLGLGAPDDADRFVGAGAELGLLARHRSGVTFGAELRAAGRKTPRDTAIVRARVAWILGYTWRRRSFELAALGAFTVEPWWIRADGRASDLADPAGRGQTRRPLLGGRATLIAGHRFDAGALAVRLGPRLDVGASSAVGDRGRVAQLLVREGGDTTTVGRLGGWELALGLDCTVWIPVGRDRRRPRR